MSAYDGLIKQITSELANNQSILSVHELYALVKAICRKESNFNPNAANESDKERSYGLMQINTKVHPLSKEDALDPEKNIRYGTSYLITQLNRYRSLSKAISAYNAGHSITSNLLTYVAPVIGFFNVYKAEAGLNLFIPFSIPSLSVATSKYGINMGLVAGAFVLLLVLYFISKRSA